MNVYSKLNHNKIKKCNNKSYFKADKPRWLYRSIWKSNRSVINIF